MPSSINTLLSEYVKKIYEIYGQHLKPITKNETHFRKWLGVYPFYTNVQKEGIEIYVST